MVWPGSVESLTGPRDSGPPCCESRTSSMLGRRTSHEEEATHARADRPQAPKGDRLLNESKDLTEVLRHLEVSESRWNRWRNHGMKADEVKRLRELERENARLEKIVADEALE